jgi:hypothetical protein
VGFNILQPALNQINDMNMKKGAAIGVGLSAAGLLAAGSADAAEVAQLAAGDGRLGLILTIFVPAVAFVAFNILQVRRRCTPCWPLLLNEQPAAACAAKPAALGRGPAQALPPTCALPPGLQRCVLVRRLLCLTTL